MINHMNAVQDVCHPRVVKRKRTFFGKTIFVDDYRLMSKVGAGASGVVKKAIKTTQGSYAAIKVVSTLSNSEEKTKLMIDQVMAEANVMSRLNHPHIVHLVDFMTIESKKQLYLVTNLAPHGDLFDVIRSRGRMSEEPAKSLFKQLLLAVSYMHSQKVAHRDLKPENILADLNPLSLQVCDFGLAIEWDKSKPLLTVPVGTTRCIPPEMLPTNSEPQKIEYNPFSVDIWACGVIYFFMLTGYFPFEAQTKEQTLSNIRACSFAAIPDHMSPPSVSFLKMLFAPNPNDRPEIDEILSCEYMRNCNPII
eukprot:c20216_g1_i1.p1 GENE.c20216_g1_i1~~c20216_g1_i1.p1  ORF type:complete len:307 (+),score=92.03 c20216_g1_i1:78-998(+)